MGESSPPHISFYKIKVGFGSWVITSYQLLQSKSHGLEVGLSAGVIHLVSVLVVACVSKPEIQKYLTLFYKPLLPFYFHFIDLI